MTSCPLVGSCPRRRPRRGGGRGTRPRRGSGPDRPDGGRGRAAVVGVEQAHLARPDEPVPRDLCPSGAGDELNHDPEDRHVSEPAEDEVEALVGDECQVRLGGEREDRSGPSDGRQLGSDRPLGQEGGRPRFWLFHRKQRSGPRTPAERPVPPSSKSAIVRSGRRGRLTHDCATGAASLTEMDTDRSRGLRTQAVVVIGAVMSVVVASGLLVLPMLQTRPTATPAPTAHPFAAPITSATYTVNVDRTGSTDVTAALNAFVARVPDGSIISFPLGTYKISSSITFNSRHNLIFDGNGSTLNNVGNAVALGGDASFFAAWATPGATHITIRNFVAVAHNPYPGYIGPPPATESNSQAAGFLMTWGGQYIELANVTMSGIYGDMAGLNNGTQYVWVHDNHAFDLGRNGVSVVWASHVLVERNAFDLSYGSSLDIEPEAESAGYTITDIVFRNNTTGTINAPSPWFFAANGNSTTGITNVTVTGNTTTKSSLQSLVEVNGSPRRSNISFTNNVATSVGTLKGYAHAFFTFAHIDGLTVTGNVQPLTSGALVSITDCTGVTNH
jgi:hypothetical protein